MRSIHIVSRTMRGQGDIDAFLAQLNNTLGQNNLIDAGITWLQSPTTNGAFQLTAVIDKITDES